MSPYFFWPAVVVLGVVVLGELPMAALFSALASVLAAFTQRHAIVVACQSAMFLLALMTQDLS